jgi:uncharacterized membrane protein YgcG
VSTGDAFTSLQRDEIVKAIADAERVSGRKFSVYVGASEAESRPFAEQLHARLDDPDNSVLIMVDPAARQLEIVTGAIVRRTVSNRQAALASLTMQTAFATGDLTRGLLSGLQQLAESARTPEALHTDTP